MVDNLPLLKRTPSIQAVRSLNLFQNKHFIGLTLAISLVAAGINAPLAVAQNAGPPVPKPKVDPAGEKGGVKDSLMKLFKKSDKAEDKEIRPLSSKDASPYGTTTPNILDSASDRSVPREKPKAADKKPEQPKSAPMVSHPPLLNQPPLDNVKVDKPVVSPENPPVKLVTLDNPTNPFGFTDAENKLNQVGALLDNKDYNQAKVLLTPLRQSLVDLTEAHIGLYKALGNIPSARAQAELEKQLALQFALLRDKAMYQMGTINVVEKNYKNAIKELTEVIKSQPRSELGVKSYKMLQEIGFTEKLQLAE